MEKKPYLSVICSSRNDNHGHSLNYRTQIFLNCLALQCEKHLIKSELIFVEWNPPSNEKRIIEALAWPKSNYLDIRIIEFPSSLHNKFLYSDRIPLYQMIAKNVGISRAQGEFVLATNIDIIFSDAAFKFIKHNLKKDIIYTAIRSDIPDKFPDISDEEKIKYAPNNVLRIHLPNYSLNVNKLDIFFLKFFKSPYGRFLILRYEVKKLLNRKKEKFHKKNIMKFSPLMLIFLKEKISRIFKPYSASISLISYLKEKISRIFKHYSASITSIFNFFIFILNPKNPHTNACGDFTLCSAEIWRKLRGYAEWDLYSWHLDSLFIHQAVNSGYESKIIKGSIFHIEHSPGSGYTPENQDLLFNRLKSNRIPYLSNDDLLFFINKQKHDLITVYNSENWGFNNISLQEFKT